MKGAGGKEAKDPWRVTKAVYRLVVGGAITYIAGVKLTPYLYQSSTQISLVAVGISIIGGALD